MPVAFAQAALAIGRRGLRSRRDRGARGQGGARPRRRRPRRSSPTGSTNASTSTRSKASPGAASSSPSSTPSRGRAPSRCACTRSCTGSRSSPASRRPGAMASIAAGAVSLRALGDEFELSIAEAIRPSGVRRSARASTQSRRRLRCGARLPAPVRDSRAAGAASHLTFLSLRRRELPCRKRHTAEAGRLICATSSDRPDRDAYATCVCNVVFRGSLLAPRLLWSTGWPMNCTTDHPQAGELHGHRTSFRRAGQDDALPGRRRHRSRSSGPPTAPSSPRAPRTSWTRTRRRRSAPSASRCDPSST